MRASPVGMFKVEVRGEVAFVNRRWCDILGLEPQDANERTTAFCRAASAQVGVSMLRVKVRRMALVPAPAIGRTECQELKVLTNTTA